MFPSSRAWRGHSFGSLVDSTLISEPGFGPADGGLLLAHLLSSLWASRHLPRDIGPNVTCMLLNSPQIYKDHFSSGCSHLPAKRPLLPSVFSTWILRRCRPRHAQTHGHKASVCLRHPLSGRALHTTLHTAASQAEVGISCCSFSWNYLSWPFHTVCGPGIPLYVVSSDVTEFP